MLIFVARFVDFLQSCVRSHANMTRIFVYVERSCRRYLGLRCNTFIVKMCGPLEHSNSLCQNINAHIIPAFLVWIGALKISFEGQKWALQGKNIKTEKILEFW